MCSGCVVLPSRDAVHVEGSKKLAFVLVNGDVFMIV